MAAWMSLMLYLKPGKHSALAGGQVLRGIEGERYEPFRMLRVGGADHFTLVSGRKRVGRVLDDAGILRIGQAKERVHITRLPVEMNWDHRFDPTGRPSSHDLLHCFRIDIERLRVNVNQQRASTGVLDHVDAGGGLHRRA